MIYSHVYLDAAVTAGLASADSWVDLAYVNADADPNVLKAYMNGVDVTFKTVDDFLSNGDMTLIHEVKFIQTVYGNILSLPAGKGVTSFISARCIPPNSLPPHRRPGFLRKSYLSRADQDYKGWGRGTRRRRIRVTFWC